MKIKVCGITQVEQLIQLDELGIDFAGLIFVESSSRYVLNKIKRDEFDKLNLRIKKTGVFVNAAIEDVISKIEAYHLDAVQLHGEEDPNYCRTLQDYARVIKAFRIGKPGDNNIDSIVNPYKDSCNYYLFDTYSEKEQGGTGKRFEWGILEGNEIGKSFFLSGGIGLDNVDEIRSFKHPFFYGTDINSRMEATPGIKDMDRVRQFKFKIEK